MTTKEKLEKHKENAIKNAACYSVTKGMSHGANLYLPSLALAIDSLRVVKKMIYGNNIWKYDADKDNFFIDPDLEYALETLKQISKILGVEL